MPEKTLQEVGFKLRWGEQPISGAARIPAEPIRPVDLLPVLRQLNDALIHAAVREVESQGRRVSCRAGCGACCRQMVLISETEARFLADLISAMPDEQRERMTARFAEAVTKLRAGGFSKCPPIRTNVIDGASSILNSACPARSSSTKAAASTKIGRRAAASIW